MTLLDVLHYWCRFPICKGGSAVAIFLCRTVGSALRLAKHGLRFVLVITVAR